MTNEEVNRIIVDFMGWEFDYHKIGVMLVEDGETCDYSELYTESLDALVPVWERLDNHTVTTFDGILLSYYKDKDSACFIVIEGYDSIDSYHDSDTRATIQEAAAHATAKAIKELE